MRFFDLIEEHDRNGFRRTASESWRLPRSRRNPAARRSKRATVCFSMYSLMSMRIMAFSSSNKIRERAANSVCQRQWVRENK